MPRTYLHYIPNKHLWTQTVYRRDKTVKQFSAYEHLWRFNNQYEMLPFLLLDKQIKQWQFKALATFVGSTAYCREQYSVPGLPKQPHYLLAAKMSLQFPTAHL